MNFRGYWFIVLGIHLGFRIGLISMLCNRCHERETKVKVTITDSKTGREFSQHFCSDCADEILASKPEVAKELNDAQTEQPPANIKSSPAEWISDEYREVIRRRAGP